MATVALGANARAATPTVSANGRALEAPVVQNGTTYVPLTELLAVFSEEDVRWNSAQRTATAKTEFFVLSVPVGEAFVLADEAVWHLASPSFIHNGRTYVPLRSLAALLGGSVNFTGWDNPIIVSTDNAISFTEDDLYWLSRIISAESRGESLLGQVAVGNVVLNRVASSEFPGSIYGVVFDRKDAVQFEPVANGTVHHTPTPQSTLAARLVLNGTQVVDDCLYFFNPSLSQGKWIRENRSYYATIGCHSFYR